MEDKNKKFTIVEHKKVRKIQNYLAQNIFFWLCVYRNRKTNLCCPSIKTLANDSYMSRFSVMKSIKYLVSNGFIEKRRGYSNTYIINVAVNNVAINNVVYSNIERCCEQHNYVADADTNHTKRTILNNHTKEYKESFDASNMLAEIPRRKKDDTPYDAIRDLYHKYCPMLDSVRKLSDKRKSHIKARCNEKELVTKWHNPETNELEIYHFNDLRCWKRFFEKVASSPFLTGNVERKDQKPFLASFDWVINESNFIKILENKYVQREAE